MNIKLKLSLQFTLIVFGILIFFAGLVYYFFYTSQADKFHELLHENAENTAVLLIDVSEIDSTLLKKIHQSTISLEAEEIVLTDSSMNILYDNNVKYLTPDFIGQNLAKIGLRYFSVQEKDGVCYVHHFKNRKYYVFVAAHDRSRHEVQAELLKVLIWSVLISLWLSIYLSYLFSRNSIQPISKIIKSVKEINSSKLNNRLDEGNRRDEIAQLAITFNEMLSDLENAFGNQKEFISNASHELKTPLSVMMIESDYFLTKEHSPDEYRSHIKALIDDIRNINTLLNSLLEVAYLNRNNRITFSKVRIDEVVFSAIKQVKIKFQGRSIIPKILYPDNQEELLIEGDASLLTIAFKNLIENACKFSTVDVLIEFQIESEFLRIFVTDSGIGIPEQEINNIYEPFQRASNVTFKSGFGIGLSLVTKILEIHNVEMKVSSRVNVGTRFELIFKRLGSQE